MRKNPIPKLLLLVALIGPLSTGLATYGQENLKPEPTPTSTLSLGPYYALVIGIDNYKYLTKLETPVRDAKDLAKLLHEQYGFQEPKLLLNGNATRKDIYDALIEYEKRLPRDSNLLIFYAGHGYHDVATNVAYWLPVDAQTDNRDRWISASDITANIRAMQSRHVLIISDSCYSGALTREAKESLDRFDLASILKSRSRHLMSSGGDEPVADSGARGHSIFANAVLKSLTEIREKQFTAVELFGFVRRVVAGNSAQVPQFESIRDSGDDYGDFVFSRGLTSVLTVRDVANDGPDRTYYSGTIPDITCKRELLPQSIGPKIQEGETVPCKLLDQPLKWLKAFDMPDLQESGGSRKRQAMFTMTVDEDGWIVEIKGRGSETSLELCSALKEASRLWRTNRPTYQGKHVKALFALDIDVGQ